MKTIGIIGAMENEVTKLQSLLEQVEIETIASMKFIKGYFSGKDVVVVRSGVGKVNSGICAQILSTVYKVDIIVNTGIAGSLKNEINIGDIVVSTDAIQHDVDAAGFGYEPGVIPQMKNSTFVADKQLRALAVSLCKKVNQDIEVFEGRIATGDQFISAPEVKKRIVERFDAYCCEMEGAAIAQVAYLNQIPFLIVRAISDKADNSAVVDYPVFEEKAIDHTVKLVTTMLGEIEE